MSHSSSNKQPFKFCRDCGKARETGSLIFYECPLDGAWKSTTDRCVLHNEEFDHAGNMTVAASDRSVQITLSDCPFTSPYFGSKKQTKELLEDKRKTVPLWMRKEDR